MAGVVSVYLDTGGTDTNPANSDDIDGLGPPTLLFKRADNSTIDANNPIVIPAAGTKYSRWKQIYLYCDTAPSLQIDNVKIYTDGGDFGAGITVKVSTDFPTKNNGSDAGYDVSDTDDQEIVASHDGVTASADFFGYTSGAALSVSISEAGNIIDAIGETTNYVVLQMEVTNAASAGDLAAETITWQFDEI